MALDQPAFSQALWAGFLAGKLPRPEYLLPVLYSESGFSTTITNSIGCQGINQACPTKNWQPPAGYTSWSASQQLTGVVTPMYGSNIAAFGPLGSGTRAYQSNFLPSTLATAKSLDSVLAHQGSSTKIPRSQLTEAQVYLANAGLDYQHKGYIAVSDLAHFIAKAAAASAVQQAIQQAYAIAPAGVGPQQDPVYGTDFPSGAAAPATPSSSPLLIAFGLLALGGAAYWAYRENLIRVPAFARELPPPPPPPRRRRRYVRA